MRNMFCAQNFNHGRKITILKKIRLFWPYHGFRAFISDLAGFWTYTIYCRHFISCLYSLEKITLTCNQLYCLYEVVIFWYRHCDRYKHQIINIVRRGNCGRFY